MKTENEKKIARLAKLIYIIDINLGYDVLATLDIGDNSEYFWLSEIAKYYKSAYAPKLRVTHNRYYCLVDNLLEVIMEYFYFLEDKPTYDNLGVRQGDFV